MTYLDSEVSRVNTKLIEGILSDHFYTGLTYKVMDKGNTSIIDGEGKAIHFDDRYMVYFYHRLISKRYSPSISHGLTNKHRSDTEIQLIVFSKIESQDYFETKLNEVDRIEINSMDFDSYKIFKSETQGAEFKFDKYFIYSINYSLNYHLKKCLTL